MLKNTSEQIITDLKKIKQTWKAYTEILYSSDVNIYDTLKQGCQNQGLWVRSSQWGA